jgi:hypothetical protein
VTPEGLHDRLRQVLGDSPEQHVADVSGIPVERVRRMRDGAPLTAEVVIAVCSAFDISADWLLAGRGPKLASQARAEALAKVPTEDLLASLAASARGLRDAGTAPGCPGVP